MSSSTAVVTSSKQPVRANQPKKKLPWFWAPECRYDVIKMVAKEYGYKLQDDEKNESKSNMFWVDIATIQDRFMRISPWQTVNHFPGMPNIARKQRMGQNLNKMHRVYPREYSFYPRTWILPAEMSEFRANFDSQGYALNNKIFIIKPDAGCQGVGIFLTKTWDQVPQQQAVVAQLYIKKPLLIDGFKFDLRIYTLVTSIKPLRMYLFQDGLVRLCTEEYVKPNKSNMNNTTMHLTNYSLNKNAEGFVQPTGSETGEGSKRSLKWFMDMIREEKGDAKADWLWRRMGRLCVRTVLSILPILNREYDQHFKSFNNVPYNINVTQQSNSSFINVNGGKGGKDNERSEKDEAPETSSTKSRPISAPSASTDNSDENTEDEEEDEEESEEEAARAQKKEKKSKTKKREPATRGSRCFEILGIDIMLDSFLKPWLIEVNHLPSFGTDSPLDQDIKERLMRQVFKVLPVRADDEQAYSLFHKSEAARRLTGKNAEKTKPMNASEAQAAKRKLDEERKWANKVKGDATITIPDDGRGEELPKLSVQEEEQKRKAEQLAAELEAERLAREALAKEEADKAAALAAATQEALALQEEEEEVTPERLKEITETLVEIYKIHSPDKVTKIHRLLQKYLGREEEFLRFVYHKYNITPPTKVVVPAVVETPPSPPRELAAGLPSSATSSVSGSASTEPTKPVANKPADKSKNPPNRRYSSRSLSPPAVATRRAPANWKLVGVEEDKEFRQEILDLIIPKDDDVWMELEMKHLTEFTRIFPEIPEEKEEAEAVAAAVAEGENEEDEDVEAERDDEDEEDETKKKTATPEDLVVQSFAIDKRATMRLHHPLAARIRPPSEPDIRESTSLPPVDNRPAFGSIASNAGKGVVGWRPPPKKEIKSEVRVPTQNQLDAAKRLSLGLSVAKQNSSNSSRNRAIGSLSPAVILDPDTGATTSFADMTPAEQQRYIQQMQHHVSAGGSMPIELQQGQQYIGGGLNGGNSISDDQSLSGMQWGEFDNASQASHGGGGNWHSTQQHQRQMQAQAQQQAHNQQHMQQLQMQQMQLHMQNGQGVEGVSGAVPLPINRQKLTEEAKLTRMRLEASKNTPAAVLRQQVYRFTEDQPGGGSQGGGKAGTLDGVPTTIEYLEGPAAQQQSMTHGMAMLQQQQQQHSLLQQQLQMQQLQRQQQASAAAHVLPQQQQQHQQQYNQQQQQHSQPPKPQMQYMLHVQEMARNQQHLHHISHAQQIQSQYPQHQPTTQQSGATGLQLQHRPSQGEKFQLQAQAQRQFLANQQAQAQGNHGYAHGGAANHAPQYFGIGGGAVAHPGGASATEHAHGSHSSGPHAHHIGLAGGSVGGGGSVSNMSMSMKAQRLGPTGKAYAQYHPPHGRAAANPQGGSGGETGPGGDAPQDALLRELFPGWFP